MIAILNTSFSLRQDSNMVVHALQGLVKDYLSSTPSEQWLEMRKYLDKNVDDKDKLEVFL